MRRTYSLSTETIKVINGNATKVAEEFGCEPSYIHQILGQSVTDPFAKFEWLFASAVKAGCDVSPYLNRLDAIQAKYRGGNSQCVETETIKFVKESADVPIAKIDGRPYHVQLTEVTQAITQGEILKDALISAINAEKEEFDSARKRFGGKEVSTVTRERVRSIRRGA